MVREMYGNPVRWIRARSLSTVVAILAALLATAAHAAGAGDEGRSVDVREAVAGDADEIERGASPLVAKRQSAIRFSSKKLLFGNTQAGTVSQPLKVTLTNVGSAAIEIIGVQASLPFASTQNCVRTLSGNGGSCDITVRFAPSGLTFGKPTKISGVLTVQPKFVRGPRPLKLSGVAFGSPPPPPAFSTTQILVANSCDWVTSYAAGASGDSAPIGPLPTSLCFPTGVALDSSGRIFVTNSDNSISEYAAGSSGNESPISIIRGPHTGLQSPVGIALDSSGNIYVANCAMCASAIQDTVTEYAAGSSGDATPIKTIAGGNTGLSSPTGIAIDASNNIFVLNRIESVTEYSAGSDGNVVPIATLTGGCNNGLCGPAGLALDSAGNIYVTNRGFFPQQVGVSIYPAGANGVVPPTAVITGADTGLDGPQAIAVDTSGNIFVSNQDPMTLASSLTVYQAGSHDDATPIATISGPDTGIGFVRGIAIDAGGNIFSANFAGGHSGTGSVTVHSPGSNGDAAPGSTVASTSELAGAFGVALDSTGKIYVANFHGGPAGLGSVTIYPAGSHANVPPSATIVGPSTGLSEPKGIAVDHLGRIYVTNLGNDSVTVYPAGANGDIAPIATISGPDSKISVPYGVAVDSDANIYVANDASLCGTCLDNIDKVTVYLAGSSGNAKPLVTIDQPGGPLIEFPQAIAVDSRGDIYVANAGILGGQPDSVRIFPSVNGGGGTLSGSISGDNTGLLFPRGLGLDANANIYVTNFDGAVTIFPAGSVGDVSPGAFIAGPDTLLEAPLGIAVAP